MVGRTRYLYSVHSIGVLLNSAKGAIHSIIIVIVIIFFDFFFVLGSEDPEG